MFKDQYFSAKEVSQIIGVSIPTVHSYVKNKILPALQYEGFIKVHVDDLLNFLRKSKSNGEIRAIEANVHNYLFERERDRAEKAAEAEQLNLTAVEYRKVNIRFLINGMLHVEVIPRKYRNELRENTDALQSYINETEYLQFIADCFGMDSEQAVRELDKLKFKVIEGGKHAGN